MENIVIFEIRMFCSSCGTACAADANFCYQCGRQLMRVGLRHFSCVNCGLETSQQGETCKKCVDDTITEYFHRGYPYNAIVGLLKRQGISMVLRTLKRKLQDLGLSRRGQLVDEDACRRLIEEEIQGAGRLAGYRSIWHALRLRHQVHVPRNLVARLVKQIDPDGVEERKSRRLTRRKYLSLGPNFCWHIDGYDKLKPYGFPIHGSICGFSRRIIWLDLVKSNNDPRIPATLFLEAVTNLGGCPMLVRSDCGTENGIIAAMQSVFRSSGDDAFAAEKSHIYGSSHSNQRIEGWWSFLRRNRTSWWIDHFKDMVESNLLQLGNDLHMECLWFCFSHLIQDDLDKVREHWNSHYIRKSRFDTVSGIPDILYLLPEYVGKHDCLVSLNSAQIEEMKANCQVEEQDNIYLEYFESVMEEMGMQSPVDEEEAFDLFNRLTELQN